MTQTQIQAAIHSLYEGDNDTPSEGSDDWNLRQSISNAAINRWEHEDGTFWAELWTKLEDAADGDTTTTAATYTYDCPSDFKNPGGYVRLIDSDGGSTYYSVIPVDKVQLYDNQDKNIVYFTGNPSSGYKLNFLDTHDAGLTISYEYYKTADTLSAAASVPEMSDPYFIVYFVISRLYKQDGQTNNYRDAFQEAEARLAQMRTTNMLPAPWQENRVEDFFMEQGMGGFGV